MDNDLEKVYVNIFNLKEIQYLWILTFFLLSKDLVEFEMNAENKKKISLPSLQIQKIRKECN